MIFFCKSYSFERRCYVRTLIFPLRDIVVGWKACSVASGERMTTSVRGRVLLLTMNRSMDETVSVSL